MGNNSYVYRHRRLDTNEIFYIGIGLSRNYKRAYDKYKRSKFWKNITSKAVYEVEIIYTNISWEDACELETLLISSYGRKDLGTGCLVNLTDGGDGLINPSIEERKRRSDRMKGTFGELSSTWGRKHTLEEKSRMKGKRDSISGKNHPQYGKKRPEVSLKNSERKGFLNSNYGKVAINAKIILDIETGIFYNSAKEASKYYDIDYSNLKKYLNGTYNVEKIQLRYV